MRNPSSPRQIPTALEGRPGHEVPPMMLLENDDCDPHEQRFEQMLQKYDAWT